MDLLRQIEERRRREGQRKDRERQEEERLELRVIEDLRGMARMNYQD